MKKTLFSLAMLAVLSSSTAFAYSDYTATPVSGWQFPPVTIPLYQGHVMFGAEGDYNLITSRTFVATLEDVTNAATGAITNYSLYNSPNSSWGYRLYAGYTFPNSANDVELIFQDYNEHHTFNISAGNPGTLANPVSVTIPNFPILLGSAIRLDRLTSKISYHYEYIDFIVGHHLDFGCAFDLRLFGGLRGLDLNKNESINAFTDGFAVGVRGGGATNFVNFFQENNYYGIGLRAGLDGKYNLGYGFAITGTAGTALIPVSFKTFSGFGGMTTYTNGSTTPAQGLRNAYVTNTLSVAPELDGRLGIKYVYSFANNGSDENSVGIEGGYHMETYFGTLGGFAMRGPYVKADVNF